MTPLPITLALFTSTKGHFGSKDLYKATLTHLDRQVPLALFGTKVAHVKVSPHETAVFDAMKADLEARGFKVLATVADWSRGMSHQQGYMADLVTMTKEPSLYQQPFVLWGEDDQTYESHVVSAVDLLTQSCRMLADDNELTSVRLLRPEDLSTSPSVEPLNALPDPRWFHSPHFNLQWPLLRSRDLYLVARFIEENPQAVAATQCEMLLRLVMEPFSRSPKRHRVYHPTYASTTHLGVADYATKLAALNL